MKTHAWPVAVTTTDDYTHDGGRTVSTTVERVEPHGERQFYVTNTRSLSFMELPAEPSAA